MSLMRSFNSGIKALFHKQQRSREMDEELRAFQEASAQEKMRQGMSDRQAQRAARVEMGGGVADWQRQPRRHDLRGHDE